jgi:predicted transcriptional regulator of viral defense system
MEKFIDIDNALMNDAIVALTKVDRQNARILRKAELRAILRYGSERSFSELLRRLVQTDVLERVSRGVYLNLLGSPSRGYLVEEIACALRKGYFNYVSLESILSEFGIISQIMISRITVMTTGSSGVFETPYGVIEFTHTSRSLESLKNRTVKVGGRPLLLATKEAGISDLRRVGRNVNMIDIDEVDSY